VIASRDFGHTFGRDVPDLARIVCGSAGTLRAANDESQDAEPQRSRWSIGAGSFGGRWGLSRPRPRSRPRTWPTWTSKIAQRAGRTESSIWWAKIRTCSGATGVLAADTSSACTRTTPWGSSTSRRFSGNMRLRPWS